MAVHRKRFIAGLDLGKLQDNAVLIVFEVREDENRKKIFVCILIWIWPTRTMFKQVGADILKIFSEDTFFGQEIILMFDRTGIGEVVAEIIETMPARIERHGVVWTAGRNVTREGRDYLTPKIELISSLQVAFESDQIHVSSKIKHADTFKMQLLNYRQYLSSHGHVKFEGGGETVEEGDPQKDDVVSAASMPIWWQTRRSSIGVFL
jgi:hypothetical protein